MAKPNVIVTRRWPAAVEARLSELFEVRLNHDDRAMDPAALMDALSTADAVFTTVSDRIDAEVLAAEPLNAKLLGSFGVGFNHIDIEAAKARGITVTNTPDVLTDATADLAMTLLLMVARRAGEGERHLRAGAWSGWRPTHMMGTQVTGKTLGLVGFGRIGRAVASRAHHGFAMKILFHDPYPPAPEQLAALGAEPCATVEELLGRSDFVSLHCPGGAATRHLIDSAALACMKPGAHLVNTSRGDVIEEAALAAALRAGQIAGAGLDVYEGEPKVSPALLEMENVVLLPHLGSATEETRVAMGMKVIENAEAYFAGREPPNRVA